MLKYYLWRTDELCRNSKGQLRPLCHCYRRSLRTLTSSIWRVGGSSCHTSRLTHFLYWWRCLWANSLIISSTPSIRQTHVVVHSPPSDSSTPDLFNRLILFIYGAFLTLSGPVSSAVFVLMTRSAHTDKLPPSACLAIKKFLFCEVLGICNVANYRVKHVRFVVDVIAQKK